jgi:high-affinity iron transporter
MLGMASIAFIGVLREGLEMSLFLLAVVFDFGVASTAIGAFAGLATAIVLGYGLYRGAHVVNLRIFFQITAGFIILISAGLFGRGVFGLQTLGVFESIHWPVWDLTSNPVLGHGQVAALLKGIFGWSAEPSLEQVIVWIAYVSTATWFFYFGRLPDALARRIERWWDATIGSLADRSPVVKNVAGRER